MSKIEVNTVDVASGSTLTIGSSGKTITIPAGTTIANSGTATGFGSDSDISWQSVVTSDTTMVAGRGYFVDSSGGTKTMTLPASPAIGDAVSLVALDGATNAVTIARNSSNIEGGTANLTMTSDYGSVQLVFTDASNGWVKVNNDVPDSFVGATGGTVTTSGDFKIHTFNSSSNFVVANTATAPANNEVSYVVVAGGGGGGRKCGGGGGGAGGFREGKSGVDTYSASPKNAPAGITVAQTTYPITVGAGGAGGPSNGTNGSQGSTSTFSTITSGGGGYGQGQPGASPGPGGSGGGGGNPSPAGGSGNVPPVSPPQGSNGGNGNTGGGSYQEGGGGGGGAGAVGTNAAGNAIGGPGGAGVTTAIPGSSLAIAGGGAGGTGGNHGFPTGEGANGGGLGANCQNNRNATNGSANTGGGGGGGAGTNTSGTGGAGVVILRYKYQ